MGALHVHNKSGKSTPRPEAINSDKLPPREHPGGYKHLASGRRKYFRPHPNPIFHRQLISSHTACSQQLCGSIMSSRGVGCPHAECNSDALG
jgi:hypothetical protein